MTRAQPVLPAALRCWECGRHDGQDGARLGPVCPGWKTACYCVDGTGCDDGWRALHYPETPTVGDDFMAARIAEPSR